jgi:predicted ATPase with chaperone activity
MLAELKTERKVINLKTASHALPAAPRTPQDTGLPFLFLIELVTKVLSVRGQMQSVELAAHLKLNVSVLDALIVFMRAEKLCEVVRRGGSGTDADLTYNLTDLGRARANEFMTRNAYAGQAPVTLAAYCDQVQAQSVADMRVVRADMSREFDDVVINPLVLDQLGAAMNSRRAIFIHGPAGSGKTYLAERLAGLLKGAILVPYAVLVEGEVVQVYDSLVHKSITGATALGAAEPSASFDRGQSVDTRWVRAARPAVQTGGELTMEMLDLQYDPGTRFYQAPPHLKANNGIFIIDDLGRQRCSPVELMNRWIVPMDRHIDYLALHTGYKFLVPFDVIVVFSSNFPPEDLTDGAFLRRIGYKIHVGALTEAQYEQIFKDMCTQYGITYDHDAFHYLLREHHYKEARPLLACYPRDILVQLRDLAMYENCAPALNEKVLDWAWNNYFVGA